MSSITLSTRYFKFDVENITVARAPLLKVYYWECMGIDKLNRKLNSNEVQVEHSISLYTRQINSKPLKIILWLRNNSNRKIELNVKRIKNCDCQPLQTRVGFNQFRHLYHCPHRRLINITQEYMYMQPNELIAMSVVTYFYLYGEHKLSFELSCNDGRKIRLHFYLDVIGFDPQKCIITSELLPVDIREHRRFVQPIWVRNVTMQQINFNYSTRERGLKVVNPNLGIPRQSVWPLMVEYRATDFENNVDLTLNFNGMRSKVRLKAPGILDDEINEPDVPVLDHECSDFLYVIYPNRIDFEMEIGEERSLIVAVHNYNQKCVEFRWQSYVINDMFEISFEPQIFRLKAHHSKLCMVILCVFERPLNFRKIPAVLEVHRIFDKNTKLAKSLLHEVESIDDPKWKEDSYLEHVFLNINIKVNFRKEEKKDNTKCQPLSLGKGDKQVKEKTTTIFEKLFWEYLSKSQHMRENKTSNKLKYEQVLKLNAKPKEGFKSLTVTKNIALRILNQLTVEGCRDIAQNWYFIPTDLYSDD